MTKNENFPKTKNQSFKFYKGANNSEEFNLGSKVENS